VIEPTPKKTVPFDKIDYRFAVSGEGRTRATYKVHIHTGLRGVWIPLQDSQGSFALPEMPKKAKTIRVTFEAQHQKTSRPVTMDLTVLPRGVVSREVLIHVQSTIAKGVREDASTVSGKLSADGETILVVNGMAKHSFARGQYTLLADAPFRMPRKKDREQIIDAQTELIVEVERQKVPQRFIVTGDNQPVPGATVVVLYNGHFISSTKSRTAKNGTVIIDDLPLGLPVVVQVYPQGLWEQQTNLPFTITGPEADIAIALRARTTTQAPSAEPVVPITRVEQLPPLDAPTQAESAVQQLRSQSLSDETERIAEDAPLSASRSLSESDEPIVMPEKPAEPTRPPLETPPTPDTAFVSEGRKASGAERREVL
jgi:hypothetical protein